ncbi:hypothetical protein B0J18DRAFT_135965 [Chaetomium sp. MPI-SDFR-AT-0129]|nr:hypothetical protein B0J18DRAFT_135965 [Chaetomium sp. MPI-SDFR-AT-0129]
MVYGLSAAFLCFAMLAPLGSKQNRRLSPPTLQTLWADIRVGRGLVWFGLLFLNSFVLCMIVSYDSAEGGDVGWLFLCLNGPDFFLLLLLFTLLSLSFDRQMFGNGRNAFCSYYWRFPKHSPQLPITYAPHLDLQLPVGSLVVVVVKRCASELFVGSGVAWQAGLMLICMYRFISHPTGARTGSRGSQT